MLGRHRCSSYVVIASAVERRSHKLYMLDLFGNIWDTVKIRPGDYNAILTKQINAFNYYVSLHHQSIVIGNELIRQFREYGPVRQPVAVLYFITAKLPRIQAYG